MPCASLAAIAAVAVAAFASAASAGTAFAIAVPAVAAATLAVAAAAFAIAWHLKVREVVLLNVVRTIMWLGLVAVKVFRCQSLVPAPVC